MSSVTNGCSGSTTWEWRKVKIQPAARPPARQRRSKSASVGFETTWRRRHTLLVKYRGGAEAWWELYDGRRLVRIPGHICLHDAMRLVAGDLGGAEVGAR